MMKDVFISLGSNLGNRQENIEAAYELIESSVGKIKAKSSFFENEAVGFTSENLFINSCIHLCTELKPDQLLHDLKAIETKIGREIKTIDGKYSSRKIDLDIIIYEDLVLSGNSLTIPHKHFRSRLFVLKPLSEIAPNQIDPLTQLTVNQLLELLHQED